MPISLAPYLPPSQLRSYPDQGAFYIIRQAQFADRYRSDNKRYNCCFLFGRRSHKQFGKDRSHLELSEYSIITTDAGPCAIVGSAQAGLRSGTHRQPRDCHKRLRVDDYDLGTRDSLADRGVHSRRSGGFRLVGIRPADLCGQCSDGDAVAITATTPVVSGLPPGFFQQLISWLLGQLQLPFPTH